MFAHDTPRKSVQTRTLVGRKSVDPLAIGGHPWCVDVRRHDSVDEFRALAEPVYRRDPVVHTIELTLLGANKFPDDSLLLTVWDDGAPVAAALQTPPYPLACNGIPADTMDTVVDKLVEWCPELTGVRGVRSSAAAFAHAWHAITGRAGTVSTEERLYRLGTLRGPTGVSGAARVASDDDRGVLVNWVELFFQETFSHAREDASGAIYQRIGFEAVADQVRIDFGTLS